MLFCPSQRRLTEEQFWETIEGKGLNPSEEQSLRIEVGLGSDPNSSRNIFSETTAVMAWQKIRDNSQ